MDNSVDVKNLRENPELFKNMLKDTIEEIINGIAKGENGQINKEAIGRYIAFIQERYKRIVYPMLDNMWEQYQITEKIASINKLEETYPKDYIAWRPTPGEIPHLILRGNYLTELRDRLIHKIEKCNKEERILTNQLITEAATLKSYMEKLKQSKELLSTMVSEYKNFVQQKQ